MTAILPKTSYQTPNPKKYPAPDDPAPEHPQKANIIHIAAEKFKYHLAAGNYEAARNVVDGVHEELTSWQVSLDSPITMLDFDSRMVVWLSTHGYATVRDLAEASDQDFLGRKRFHRNWLALIRESVRRVVEVR